MAKGQMTQELIDVELLPSPMSGLGWQVKWHIQLEEAVDLPQCHMKKNHILVAVIVLLAVAMVDLVAQENQFGSDPEQCKGENLSHPYHLAGPRPLIHPNNTSFQVLTQ